YNVQRVLDAGEKRIAEETARAANRHTVSPVAPAANRTSMATAAARVNGTATVNSRRVSVNNNNNNRASTTVRPAAIPTPVQSPGNQVYPLMQSSGSQPYPLMQAPGSQPYPLMQTPGQIYPPLPQQQGYGQLYPMIPLQHQHQLGGSPQGIPSDLTDDNMMTSPSPIYGSSYSANPRGPELISVAQSDYAESHGGFAGSQTSFVGQSNSPASGSASDLVRSPQQRHNN
ncbi:hypothetical protein BGZ91_011811, partial [Linnemannia elongata]